MKSSTTDPLLQLVAQAIRRQRPRASAGAVVSQAHSIVYGYDLDQREAAAEVLEQLDPDQVDALLPVLTASTRTHGVARFESYQWENLSFVPQDSPWVPENFDRLRVELDRPMVEEDRKAAISAVRYAVVRTIRVAKPAPPQRDTERSLIFSFDRTTSVRSNPMLASRELLGQTMTVLRAGSPLRTTTTERYGEAGTRLVEPLEEPPLSRIRLWAGIATL